MLALLADTAALHVAVDVHGLVLGVDLLVVAALVRVAIAVAGLTLIWVFPGLDLSHYSCRNPNHTESPYLYYNFKMMVPV